MEGVLRKISLTKRMAEANQVPRPYSANQVAANTPTGVPMSTPAKHIINLPTMALRIQPSAPGDCVYFTNIDKSNTSQPCEIKDVSNHTNQNRVKSVAIKANA